MTMDPIPLSGRWHEAESVIRELAQQWFELLATVSDDEYGGYQDQIYPGDFIRAVRDRARSASSKETFESHFRSRLTPQLSDFLAGTLASMSLGSSPRDLFSVLAHGLTAEIEAYNGKRKRSVHTWRTSARSRERLRSRQLPVDAEAFDPFELKLESILYGLYVVWHPISRIVIPDARAVLLNALMHDRSFVRVISPRQFEEVIAFLYEILGCRVELTQATRDLGPIS